MIESSVNKSSYSKNFGLLIEKIRKTHREERLAGTLRKVSSFISQRVYYRKYFWYERDLLLPIHTIRTKVPIEIDVNSRDEVIDWIKNKIYHGIPYDDEILENKIASANEHIFPCAKVEGQIIGCMKIGFNQVYIKNFEEAYRFKEGIGFIYAAYVDPQYRGRGIYTFLRTEATKMLSEKGVKKIVSHVRSSNISAIKANMKCGSRVTYSNRQLKCFSFNFFGKLPKQYLRT